MISGGWELGKSVFYMREQLREACDHVTGIALQSTIVNLLGEGEGVVWGGGVVWGCIAWV